MLLAVLILLMKHLLIAVGMWMLLQMLSMRRNLCLLITGQAQAPVLVIKLQCLILCMSRGVIFKRIFSLLITMGFITMLTLRVPVIQLHLMIPMGHLLVIPMGLLLMIPMGHLLMIPMGHLLMIRTEFLQSLQMMDMGVLLALIMRMMYFPSITMGSITLAQNPQLQVVPVTQLLPVSPMLLLLIVMALLFPIVIMSKTSSPSITMVFITMVGQVIRLLLQIPMELLEKYPPRATLHQQLGTLCLFLAATRIPRLTSCQSISSLRSPLV